MKNIEGLIKGLELILRKVNTENQADIDISSANFTPTTPFQLYVGVAGTVVGIDKRGNAISRHFVAGYHPISFKQITRIGTTATSLAALY